VEIITFLSIKYFLKMKKIINLFVILSIFSIAFYGCKKDNEPATQKNSSASNDLKIEKQIINFKNKIKSNLKSDETLSIDSAVWYVEAALNYSHSVVQRCTEFKVDTIVIPVPVNDGKVSLQDLSSAMSSFEESIASDLANSGYANASLYLADISVAHLKSINNVNLKMTALVNSGYIDPTHFHVGDDWIWGGRRGKCDGTCVGRDAATELTRVSNMYVAIPSGSYYYTDLEEIWIDPFENPPTPPNPWGFDDTPLFRAYTPFNPCIPYDAMNYYLNNLVTLSNTNTPTGKSLNNILCIDDIIVGEGSRLIFHWGIYTYGILHVSSGGETK
jgi:hypothetical protein